MNDNRLFSIAQRLTLLSLCFFAPGARGHIALQLHGGQEMGVLFDDVQ